MIAGEAVVCGILTVDKIFVRHVNAWGIVELGVAFCCRPAIVVRQLVFPDQVAVSVGLNGREPGRIGDKLVIIVQRFALEPESIWIIPLTKAAIVRGYY